MLERQHTQLLTGLQELYRRAQNGQGWDGPPLDPINRGRPLAHKILDALGVLCKDEWEDDDGPDGMSSWQSFEQQSHRGSDILHDHSDTVSPATTMAISPLSVPPPAFPLSTIKAKRPSKYKASRPPTSQPLSTAPLPVLDPYADSYKNLLASDPGHYSSGPQLQTPTPTAPFNLAILENDNLSYDSMEWDMGTDDIFDVSNYQAALPLQAIG